MYLFINSGGLILLVISCIILLRDIDAQLQGVCIHEYVVRNRDRDGGTTTEIFINREHRTHIICL